VAGTPLAVLAALWLLGRLACLVSALVPGWIAVVADLAFPVALEAIAARELVAARNRRNYKLLAPVAVLATANLLMHLQALGVAVPIGIGWRLGITAVIALISVIGGRIVPAFTRNWLTGRGASRLPASGAMADYVVVGPLLFAMVLWTFLPDRKPVGALLLLAAALHAARLARWRGVATVPDPLLLALHVGYLWLVAGVALLGLSLLTDAIPSPAAVHALTAGAMGTMILAVMTRATLGHTGHPLRADAATITIFALVSASAVLRIAAAWPLDAQMGLLEFSGLVWIGAFTLLLAKYGPMLLSPRL
jgi:uncharacterized protein involved in response to NO